MAEKAPQSPAPVVTRSVRLENEAMTQALAAWLVPLLRAGDMVALRGDLGAGKTTFARYLIRALMQAPALDVPSPTFTLLQTYEPRADVRAPVVMHADLYRLGDPDELAEIGLEEAADTAVLIVEWPERAPLFRADERLEIAFAIAGETVRRVDIEARGAMAARLARAFALETFLSANGLDEALQEPVAGDASSRRYIRLRPQDRPPVIVMDAPRQPDGPPIYNGKPYSAVAGLAENVVPFIVMAGALRNFGYSAPEIIAADGVRGFLALEDLGHEGVAPDRQPDATRYEASVALLADLHARAVSSALPYVVVGGTTFRHVLPAFDERLALVEAELLPQWYIPHAGLATLSEEARAAFRMAWRAILKPVMEGPRTWVLRDYHSPNLMWLGDREGIARVGLLDFQDALYGPPAYDVVSLLQDARVDVGEAMELALLGHYIGARRSRDPAFDPGTFARDYAIMGAQRATKILGIFARLASRDGKTGYLAHIPRVAACLRRDLAHPALEPVHDWYKAHLPMLLDAKPENAAP